MLESGRGRPGEEIGIFRRQEIKGILDAGFEHENPDRR
jgi:hypothetical protein